MKATSSIATRHFIKATVAAILLSAMFAAQVTFAHNSHDLNLELDEARDRKSSVAVGACTECAEVARKKVHAMLKPLAAKASAQVVPQGDLIPNDPRRAINRLNPDGSNTPYNAIGIVNTPDGRGSGWLANECLVWTNKHVIGKGQNIIGKKIQYYVGQSTTADRKFEYNVEGEVVASGNPNGNGSDDYTEDWALVRLKSPLGKKVGFIETAQYCVEDAKDCDLEVAGFPGEKDAHFLWWQGKCQYSPEDSGSDAFSLGCPITGGNSGSPLLCRDRKTGQFLAIGIATSAHETKETERSFALNFTVDWPNAKAAFQKYKDTCTQ